MKKTMKALLILAFVVALSACSPSAPAEDKSTAAETGTTVAASEEKSSAAEQSSEKANEAESKETSENKEASESKKDGDKEDNSISVETESTITVTDNVGREVTMPFPIKKAAVALRYNNEMIRACGAIDQVAVVDMNTAQDREYWSNFDPEKTIGKSQKALNYEAIIDSGCDVLILPANGTYKEAEEKLKDFNIPVLVISAYDTADFENQVKIIGRIFDHEEEAKAYSDYYLGVLNEISKKLENVKKKTVYWESTKDYKTSFPGNYYYEMIIQSGAENIFADEDKSQSDSEITPESVVEKNPDVIVKNITPDKALSGSGIYDAPALEQREATIKAIKERSGWDTITAVKNNDVYVMSQFGHGGASKIVGAAYIAKWVYPEALADFNPDDVLKHWLEEEQKFKYIEGHFYPRPWDEKQ